VRTKRAKVGNDPQTEGQLKFRVPLAIFAHWRRYRRDRKQDPEGTDQ
jgi:hypothetical protein